MVRPEPLTAPSTTVGQLPAPLFSCDELRRRGVEPMTATAYNANLSRLQERAAVEET